MVIYIFTGLIEEMGEILSIENKEKSLKIKIRCKKVLENAKIGDSIATNGTCLTATEIGKDYFVADCMYETVKRTNLKRVKRGDRVNLEKSFTLATPLGGHLVTGDVECEGIITGIRNEGIAKIYTLEIEPSYMRYIVQKGRVTLDGASLTVMEVTDTSFSVSLIPHTQENITLGSKKVGDIINVETDLVGKYIERFMYFDKKEKEKKSESKLTMEFLAKNGF